MGILRKMWSYDPSCMVTSLPIPELQLFFWWGGLNFCCTECTSGPSSSVGIATTGWAVRGSNSGGARFSARPDRPWGPPSLLYNGYRVFTGVKCGRGVVLTTHAPLVPRSWKSRAIPLPTIWATTGPVTGTLYLLQSVLRFCFEKTSEANASE